MLQGRKHRRIAGRFLVQICAVHDPSVVELTTVENFSLHGARLTTQRYWEPLSHVEVKSTSGEFLRLVVPRARARVVYCNAIDAKGFVIGLDFLSQTSKARPITHFRSGYRPFGYYEELSRFAELTRLNETRRRKLFDLASNRCPRVSAAS